MCKYRDSVRRLVREAYGKKSKVLVARYKCTRCGYIFRVLPEYLLPYKHYRKEIIAKVIDGSITSETEGFEDYPCELTMKKWLLCTIIRK